MKQINEKLNKIAKAIDETVELPETNLITDSLDAITKALGGTPNDSNLIVDKLDDIAGVAEPKPTGNIEITENGENINVAPYATATVNVSGGTPQGVEVTLAEEQTFTGSYAGSEVIFSGDLSVESAIENMSELPDSIIVVYDDITYECSKQTDDPYYYYGANLEEEPLDWSAYPFSVEMGVGSEGYIMLLVGDENQHTVKVSYYDTTLNITSNGTYDVTNVSSADVNVIPFIISAAAATYSHEGTTYYGLRFELAQRPNGFKIIRSSLSLAPTDRRPLFIYAEGYDLEGTYNVTTRVVTSAGAYEAGDDTNLLVTYDNGYLYFVGDNLPYYINATGGEDVNITIQGIFW